jgi:hypothetical protein
MASTGAISTADDCYYMARQRDLLAVRSSTRQPAKPATTKPASESCDQAIFGNRSHIVAVPNPPQRYAQITRNRLAFHRKQQD